MSVYLYKSSFLKKSLSLLVLITFGLTSGIAPSFAQLPPVGQMFFLTSGYEPPILRGMTVHAENPLLFDFIVDRGQNMMADGPLKAESEKLIKYFLASMTIPDKDAWVNLSPFEKNRIIPEALGQTEMGKTMLEQDYMLKQLAASLTNPDTELGRKYWEEVGSREASPVKREAKEQETRFTNDASRATLSKVWIVPAGATVVEKDGFAYITESKLDVKMEEDYQNMSSPQSLSGDPLLKMDSRFRGNDKESGEDTFNNQAPGTNHQEPATAVFRSLILPKLIQEVNEGKTFAPTRQVYQSVILASWYKKALKDSLLGKVYADKSKIEGITTDEKDIKQKVYDQYLEAFKKGVYNVIKEEEVGDETLSRKYFSGGEVFNFAASPLKIEKSPASWGHISLMIIALKDRLVFVAAKMFEKTEWGARKQKEYMQNHWGYEGIPIGNLNLFLGAVEQITGIIISNSTPNPIPESYNLRLYRRDTYENTIRLLNEGQGKQIIDNIYHNMHENARDRQKQIIEKEEKAVKMTIRYFVDKILDFNTPSRIKIGDFRIILGPNSPYQNVSLLGIKETLERVVEDQKDKYPDLGASKVIIVEMIYGVSDTQVYHMSWGHNHYVIKTTFLTDPSRLINQARLLKRLNSHGGDQNIPKIIMDNSKDQTAPFIVMNYLPAKSLLDLVGDLNVIPLRRTVNIAAELAKRVKFIHDNKIVIVDLTSKNIHIDSHDAVILLDFDTSAEDDYNWTEKGDIYNLRFTRFIYDFDDNGIRFEVNQLSKANRDYQLDIANIGQAIFFAHTGQVLEEVAQVNAENIENPELRRIISRSIAPRQGPPGTALRYQKVDEMLADLQNLQTDLAASSAVYRGEIKNTAWTESVAYPPNAWVISGSGEKSGYHTVIDVGLGFDSGTVAAQLQANSQPGVNGLMSPHSKVLAGFADVIAVRQDGGTIPSLEMVLAEEVGEANKESIIKKRGSMNIVAAARMGESARKTIIDTVKEFLQLARTQNLDINQKTRLWTAPLNHLARKDHIQSVIRKLNLVINPNFLKAVSLMKQQLGLSQDEFMYIDIIPGTLSDFVQEFLNLNEVKTALEQAHIMIGKIHAPGLEYTLLDDETENPDLRSKQNPLFWMIGVHQTPATDSGMRLPGTTESLTYIAQRNDSQVKMLGYKLAKDLFQKYAATPEQLQQVIDAYEEFHKRAVIEGRSLLSIESLPGSFRDLAYEISQAKPQGNTDEEIARMLPDFVSLSEKILRTGSRFVDRFNSLVKGSRQWFFNMQFYDKYFARDVLLIGPVLRVAMDSLKYHHTLKALKEKQEAYSQLTSGHPLFVKALESLKSAVLSAVQKQGLKPESLINYFENGLPEAMSGYYPGDPPYDDLFKLIGEYIAGLLKDSGPAHLNIPIARQAYSTFVEGVTGFNASQYGKMTDQEFFAETGIAKTYLFYFLAPQMVSASSGTILTGEQDHQVSENKAVSGVVSSNSDDLGGIDFDPSKLNLQIKRDGKGVPLPLPQQDVEHIDIKGLFPVILNIGPVNVRTLPVLGKIDSGSDMALSGS